jgi:hypothetical protein
VILLSLRFLLGLLPILIFQYVKELKISKPIFRT